MVRLFESQLALFHEFSYLTVRLHDTSCFKFLSELRSDYQPGVRLKLREQTANLIESANGHISRLLPAKILGQRGPKQACRGAVIQPDLTILVNENTKM